MTLSNAVNIYEAHFAHALYSSLKLNKTICGNDYIARQIVYVPNVLSQTCLDRLSWLWDLPLFSVSRKNQFPTAAPHKWPITSILLFLSGQNNFTCLWLQWDHYFRFGLGTTPDCSSPHIHIHHTLQWFLRSQSIKRIFYNEQEVRRSLNKCRQNDVVCLFKETLQDW